MNFWNLPWIDVCLLLPLVGAVAVCRVRQPNQAATIGLAFTGAAFACALLACASFYAQPTATSIPAWSLQHRLFGHEVFDVDLVNAPLLAVVAFIHFLVSLATTRTKRRRFSFTWALVSEAVSLATFACNVPWVLVGLLIAGTVPPYLELRDRGQPTRVYVLHMLLFVALLVIGQSFVDPDKSHAFQSALATAPLLVAILVRCGTFPAHCWLTDWLERASFGNALLFVTPLSGVYAAIRLVLPIAADWVLRSIGVASLITAVYAAGMALIQRDARRFFAYLFLSNASLVLVGLELHTPISLTGALCLWFWIPLTLGGLGLILRALEARFGRLSLIGYRGLYAHSPTLAVCFLLTGLASVGFPGTPGYVAAEMLVDGAIEANLFAGLAVVLAAALNGIAIVRVYLLLFTGTRHVSNISLNVSPRERLAVLILSALIFIGGLFPQPLVAARHHAAVAILEARHKHSAKPIDEPKEPEQYPDEFEVE